MLLVACCLIRDNIILVEEPVPNHVSSTKLLSMILSDASVWCLQMLLVACCLNRDNIILVEEPVPNHVSSTKLRRLLADGQPVRYLMPDAVIAYIKQHSLYQQQQQQASRK
jgi:nicotinic acid mononucleotide adenylyltransferase